MMKPNPTIQFIDTQEIFDLVRPMLDKTFGAPRIVHCQTPKEAMGYIDSDEYADIIIADWELTGYRFMESVRRDPENHNTPVIIMSEDTTIQHIVLDKIDRDNTFFLAKPFLERGLSSTLSQVLMGMERRRKNRINPTCDLLLKVNINNSQEYDFPLVNISLDGCLFRIPFETAHQINIYEPASIFLSIDEFDLVVDGEIYRIGPDFNYPEVKETVLVMVMFSPMEQERREVLELIDDLCKRW